MPATSARPAAILRALRRFRRNRKGSAAIEFAMVAPIFIALLFAILETSMVFFAGQVLETGLHDSARLVQTNQAQSANMSQSQFKQEVCNRVSVLMSCSGIYVDVKSFPAFSNVVIADPIDGSGNFTNNTTYTQPNPGDIVVVRAYYQWPLFVTGLGYNIANVGRGTATSSRLLAATAAFRVEPSGS